MKAADTSYFRAREGKDVVIGNLLRDLHSFWLRIMQIKILYEKGPISMRIWGFVIFIGGDRVRSKKFR